MKQPEVFKPDTREQELKQWSDWRFTLENYVKSVDVMTHTEMNIISNNAEAEIEWSELNEERKEIEVVWTPCIVAEEPPAQVDQVHAP